ncbi:oxidoreductase [Microbacterium aoyamense]|uniref:Oxidoreductase n=1 Tax=Microbacterium aoyamense TaxID=344166 RepID=A0ABN2PC16_9MICO|nr:oxidoreductase [Microbacterium aoyamense]
MTTWLITGCSTGLGRALAQAVVAHGHNVIATARNLDKLDGIGQAHPEQVLFAELDVTDTSQVPSAVGAGIDRFGAIDVLVNNAGYGYRAAVEEGDDDDVRQLFATHLFGAVSMIKAVLPQMRRRGSGTIVNLSSIGARLTPAGSGYYAAVKSAIEGLNGALRREVEPLGITAMVVEPGGFRTDFAGRSLAQSRTVIEDYAETAGARRKENDNTDGTQPGDPAKGAQAIITAVESGEAPELLVIGRDAVDNYRRVLTAQLASLEKWRDLSEQTGFDDGR